MAETMIDSDTFRAYELAGWQGAVEAYNDHFGSLTSQTIGVLAETEREKGKKALLALASERRDA